MSLNVQNLMFTPVAAGSSTASKGTVAKNGQEFLQYVPNFANSAFGTEAILGGKYNLDHPRTSADNDWIG